MTVYSTVQSALVAASAAGVLDTARQGVYQTAAGARAVQATATGMPHIHRVYASELLDTNTCTSCAAVDGKEYPSVEAAHQEYHGHGGYMGCLGGLRCRGTLVFVYAETPAGGDDGMPPYTPTSITPQPNPPAWSAPAAPPAPPPPPGFTGLQINDVYGDKVLVAVRQDGSFVWPQRSTSGKWVGSDGHPLPDDVVKWLDSHPVSKGWVPNWKVNDGIVDAVRPATEAPKPPAGYTANVSVDEGGQFLILEKADGWPVWAGRRPDGLWVDRSKAFTSQKNVPLPDDVQKWLDAHPVAKAFSPKPAPVTGKVWDPPAREARSQPTGAGTNDMGTPVGDALAATNDMTLAHAGSIPYDERDAIRSAWKNGRAVLRPFETFTHANSRDALLRSRGAVQALDDAPLLGVDRIWRGMRVNSESMWSDFKALAPGDPLNTKGAASFTTKYSVADDFAGSGRRVIVEYVNPRGVALEGVTHFQGEYEVLVRGVGRHELMVQSVEYSPDGDTMLIRVTERAFSKFSEGDDRAERVARAMDYLFGSAKMTYEDGSLFG